VGIKERREREKLEVREAILEAAREIAAAEGWSAVSIRKIAERIEYSPPMVYEHFDDKDDLLYALMVDGFGKLYQRVHAARVAAPNPHQALIEMAIAYWQFSVDSPELYQVMNGLDGVQFCAADASHQAPEFSAAGRDVIEALTDWGRAEQLTFDYPEDMLAIVWGTLHGVVALAMGNRIQLSADKTRDLVVKAVQTLIAGWSCPNSRTSTG